jgi:hypothetical protein
LDTDWSYTLFFAFSAALAASFNHLLQGTRKKPRAPEQHVIHSSAK